MRTSLWVQCPACQRLTGMLDISLSRRAEDFYECEECEHVWTLPRTAPITDVATDRGRDLRPKSS